MCGIAGAIGLRSPLTDDRIERILGALEHRGPDRAGLLVVGDAWLGFRRLSILDLRQVADQPMVDADAGVALVYNGEIYNYLELRSELEAAGHRFATTGDTEVLLRGWVHWGEGVFERCNGMWAAAIRDPRREGLVLCRDRFGEKPLHLGRGADGSWWFGSEPAALRVAGAGSGRVDLARVTGFLTLGDVEDPGASWFDGIQQVPPGTLVELRATGPGPARRWWSTGSFLAERWDGPPSSVAESLDRLDRAVQLRLRSDVEVGTSLSGGVDSTSVVSSIRAVDPGRTIHTFTASFPGEVIDEWDRAAAVGERHGLAMHRVIPTVEGFADELDLLVARQGGPFESPTVYAQWCVMRAAHEAGVTVLLDGQGADETWGGYPKYVGTAAAGLAASLRPWRAWSLWRNWQRAGTVPGLDLRQAGGLLLGPAARRRVLERATAGVRSQLGDAVRHTPVPDPFEAGDGPVRGPLLRRMAHADLNRVLLPRLLRYADRSSMAWSREVRLPFLDPAVLDAAFRSGWERGLTDGWTKLALRQAVGDRVPADILWRREKVAYETPDGAWIRSPRVAASIDEARRHLVEAGILAAGGRFADHQPWRVLSLSRFLRHYDLRT